ncbi:hypothetical protein FNF31_04803 [Cafeteria roenbergensis]|uniref:Cytochrome c oxidase assembly protein COX15 n=1 Tax=Cafeteria roenbergensis TaxID=33653 RepID=A0A5A8D4B2_CAFRO|nr:hypothetical protein FNF28_05925 [Cafeteria roenbergensis]KAA0159437.1 hypothetical protein FNF31_04803 [Cafeteria roenbergensis]
MALSSIRSRSLAAAARRVLAPRVLPTRTPQRLPLGARSFSRSAPATPARASAALRRLTTTAAPAAAEETTARAVLDALRADLARKTGGLTPAKLRIVAGWLGFTAAAVFAMIVLGGITRLTRSGLSMVEWRPEGSKLPSTDEEWEVAFDKYKQFPEYKVVNSRMTLEEFKPIYFMEWFHRMWGRGLGVIFGVPALAFIASGMIPPLIRPVVGAAFGLGAAQGAVGWWMVKSGLEERKKDDFREPRVSPYRLAAHLTVAITIFSLLSWSTMDCLWAAQRTAALGAAGGAAVPGLARVLAMQPAAAGAGVATALAGRAAALAAMSPWAWGATGLVALTTVAGAFVAGNDAGRAYNDWPMYAGRMIPEQIWDATMGVRNFFENTATVQFDHRNLAYATLAAIALAGHRVAKLPQIPPAVRTATRGMAAAVAVQVGLGISTLMMYVPVSLGAAHQAGAMVLLGTGLWLRHAVSAGQREATVASAAMLRNAASGAASKAAPAATAASSALALAAVPTTERPGRDWSAMAAVGSTARAIASGLRGVQSRL